MQGSPTDPDGHPQVPSPCVVLLPRPPPHYKQPPSPLHARQSELMLGKSLMVPTFLLPCRRGGGVRPQVGPFISCLSAPLMEGGGQISQLVALAQGHHCSACPSPVRQCTLLHWPLLPAWCDADSESVWKARGLHSLSDKAPWSRKGDVCVFRSQCQAEP